MSASDEFWMSSTCVMLKPAHVQRFHDFADEHTVDVWSAETDAGTAYGFVSQDDTLYHDDKGEIIWAEDKLQYLARMMREGEILLFEEVGKQWQEKRWLLFYFSLAVHSDGRVISTDHRHMEDKCMTVFGKKPDFAI